MAATLKFTQVTLVVLIGACASHATGSLAAAPRSQWTGAFKSNRLNSELGRSAPNSGFGSQSGTGEAPLGASPSIFNTVIATGR